MPHLSPPQNGAHSSSRFSALNVFKLKSVPGSDAAPPPPPKDPSYNPSPFYNRSLFSRSTPSLAPSLGPESYSGPHTPATPYPPMPSAGLESAKRPNGVPPGVTARAAAGSPVPSASGGSLRSIGRAGADYLSSPSMDGSTDSSGSSRNASPNPNHGSSMYRLNGANSSSYAMGQSTAAGLKHKKSIFKLSNLAKRNRSRKDLSDTASASGSVSGSASVSEHDGVSGNPDGDEGISAPWNFQHNIHVDEGYIGLPPSWSAALSKAGFDEDEIAAIHAGRQAATAAAALVSNASTRAAYSTESLAFPHTLTVTPPASSLSPSATLFEPVPRSTSLGKGRDTLDIHPPSMYSIATSTAGGSSTIGSTSPAPSPRAPSFSVKSFVSDIKGSLTSDSASTKDGFGRSRSGGGAIGEESKQFVLVNGDNPVNGRAQGMEDKTLIESYLLDTSSISSFHTHNSSTRSTSQGEETPRTPNFPLIQVECARSDVGHVPFSSAPSRAPSPLAHSISLPIPTPPHGHTFYNHTASSSPSHSPSIPGLQPGTTSVPPRTPPRRIYHVANPSSDSYDGDKYAEPPPAYDLSKEEWTPKKEKEGLGVLGNPLPRNEPIPPTLVQDIVGGPSDVSSRDSRLNGPTTPNDCGDLSASGTPENELFDIASYYNDTRHVGDADGDSVQQAGVLSATSPLAIDKRLTKLAALPPRLSFHQEGSLEDWSESLFNVIGTNGKRSSSLKKPKSEVATDMKNERRTIVWPTSPLSTTDRSESVSVMALSSVSQEPSAPASLDIAFKANMATGTHARGTIDAVRESNEQGRAKENEVVKTEKAPEDDMEEQVAAVDTTTTTENMKEVDGSLVASSIPYLPDASLGPNVSPPDKGVDPPALISSSPSGSSRGSSIDSLPPPPPPKPKPKPAPLIVSPMTALVPPRTSVIPGISGRSPVNSLFGAKPQPLPIPIPPSQIRAQLRPAPPKPPHPPPSLPLPLLRRMSSQPNLQPLPPPQSQIPPVPSLQKVIKHGSTTSRAVPPDSRPDSSQTLLPAHANSGDRDSGMSTITVTPATIATAKVVRTAVASVIDSDTVSLASKRESVDSTTNAKSQSVSCDTPDVSEASLRAQETGEVPNGSLVSEASSVSLLQDGPRSKWPAPPPTPVEFERDSTPRRLSRFRTTSLGRVTQLHVTGGGGAMTSSPMSSHFSHGSSETASSSTSESALLTTPKGVNGVPSVVPKQKSGLAPEARLLSSTTDTFGGVDLENEGEEGEAPAFPSNTFPSTPQPSISSLQHPLLAQLRPFITPCDPTSCYTNLVEIAEGESGSVFAARIASELTNEKLEECASTEQLMPPTTSLVAIKRISLPPVASSPSLSDDSTVSAKLISLLHELELLKDLNHEHLLLLDAVYVGSNSGQDDRDPTVVDTSLWIRMELMERSLADVIGLVAEGLVLQERLIGRFASDILCGLDYLQRQHIAHRDVRSDNLLVNATGVVKLADFSNAIRVDRNSPIVNGAVGVIYWQAPEVRVGPYNALNVDVWSLGATVWELAETIPPFSMPGSPTNQVLFPIQNARHIGSQWPPLTHPEHYSRAFHEFLRLCGRESAARPGPGELLNTPFIRNACGRAVILQLLSHCRSIEEGMAAKEASTGLS